MFNVGGGEVLVILLLALIVLGPARLPDAARRVGSFLGEMRRLSAGFQQEFRQAADLVNEPIVKPQSDGGPTTQPIVPRSTKPTERAGASGIDDDPPSDIDDDRPNDDDQPNDDDPSNDEGSLGERPDEAAGSDRDL